MSSVFGRVFPKRTASCLSAIRPGHPQPAGGVSIVVRGGGGHTGVLRRALDTFSGGDGGGVRSHAHHREGRKLGADHTAKVCGWSACDTRGVWLARRQASSLTANVLHRGLHSRGVEKPTGRPPPPPPHVVRRRLADWQREESGDAGVPPDTAACQGAGECRWHDLGGAVRCCRKGLLHPDRARAKNRYTPVLQRRPAWAVIAAHGPHTGL